MIQKYSPYSDSFYNTTAMAKEDDGEYVKLSDIVELLEGMKGKIHGAMDVIDEIEVNNRNDIFDEILSKITAKE